MLTVLEYAFRAALVSCMLQRVSIICTDMALTRKKKIWWLYLFMPFKTFLLVACTGYIERFCPGNALVQNMYYILDMAILLLIMWFYVYLWEDEPLHILLIFLIMDSITVALVTVPVFINYLEGREDIAQLEGPFHPLDVLIPPLIMLLTYLIRPHMKRLARFLGSIYLPHRKVLWGVIFIYTFAERIFRFFGGNIVPTVVIQSSVATVLIACLMAQQVLFHLRSQREEEEFLDMQMRLLHQRAVVTQYSRTQMVETREIITRQIQELDEMLENSSSNEQGLDAKVLKGYLRELQTSVEGASHENDLPGQNDTGYRGRYCRDILTDEVLSQIADSAKAQGNSIAISLRNYDSGRIADEDLARILYCLAYGDTERKLAGKAAGDRELSLTGTDGQLIIRMSADRLQIPRSRIIAMQSVIHKYKGELSLTRSEAGEEAYVILTV